MSNNSNAENTFNFGQALEYLKSGKRVSRSGWNGKGMWLAYVPPAGLNAQAAPPEILKHLPSGLFGHEPDSSASDFRCGGYVVMSQADMFAEDWGVVEDA